MTLSDAIFACLVELDPPKDPLVTAKLTEAFEDFVEYVPEQYRVVEDSTMTVPLHDVLTNPGEAILNLIGPLFHKEMKERGFFPELRRQLLDNENAASGISSQVDRIYGRKPVIGVDEYDAEPAELARIYLRYTPFYGLLHAQIPFRIPRNLWTSHAFILGPSGWGKSQLLGAFLKEAIEDTDQRSVIILDPHAQKDNSLFRQARERMPLDRLVVINPDVNPPDLNIFDFGILSHEEAIAAFEFLLSSLAGGLSEKQQACVEPLFALLQKIPGASIQTLHNIVVEKPRRNVPLKYANEIAQLDEVFRDFFEQLFYTGNFQETRDALQWKLSRALARPAFKKMFSAERNSIDMDAYLREPIIVLIAGGENTLGKEGMRIFLLFLLSQYYAAAKRRRAKHLAMCIVDEAWMVLQSPLIADILVELRGFHCSLVSATQIWTQIAEAVRPAILGSTAIKAVGAIQHNDAEVLARDMFTKPQLIRGLSPYDGPGTSAQWAFHLTGMKKSQTVSVPYGSLLALPKLSSDNLWHRTREGPVTAEPSRSSDRTPAKADTPIVPQSPDDDEPMQKA